MGACLLTLAMLGASLAALSTAHPATAAISRGVHRPLGVHQQDEAPEKRSASDELDGVRTASIDPAMSADKVMRSRPFIVGDDAVKIVNAKPAPAPAKETTEESGNAELVAFLQKRNLGESQIVATVDLVGDRRTRKVIPSPKLRAALLMMTDWDPYQATIDAILKGRNPSGKPLTEATGLNALADALAASPADETAKKALLAKYADQAVAALIPDPSLRAALLLLGGWRPWDLTLGVVLDGANPDGVPLQIFFTDLRDSAPAVRQSNVKNDGTPAAIVINSLLRGESPAVLAAAIVEGTLLHDDTLTKDEVVASSALGTLAWADLIAAMPGAAKAKTWGTITRNIGLLALLNLADAGGAGLGVLAPATGVQGILHGVYLNSTSFSAFADGRPWGVHFDRQAELEAPPIFIDYLTFAGAPPTPGIGGIVSLSDKTLANLDSAMSVLLSPAALMADAATLSLGVGH